MHYEQSKFFRLGQEAEERLVDLANRLSEKSIVREFGAAVLDEMSLAKFFDGISREKTRQLLYAEEPTTLEGELSDAQKLENRQEKKGDTVNLLKGNESQKGLMCIGRCHHIKDCWFKNMTCNKCAEKEHLQPLCSQKLNYLSETNDTIFKE